MYIVMKHTGGSSKVQRVDPFIPALPRRTLPVKQPSVPSQRQPQLVKRRQGAMDVFVRPQKVQTHSPSAATSTSPISAQAPVQPSAPVPSQRTVKSKSKPKRHLFRKSMGFVGLAVVIPLAGVAAQTLLLGEILIAAYAVYAFWCRVPSRTTFMLALVALASIVVLRAVGRDTVLAANFAVYALLLAFVGVATLAREARQPKT